MSNMTEVKQCPLCMEFHDLELVEKKTKSIFKGEEIEFTSTYYLCKNTNELLMTESLIQENSLKTKDAYRRKVGLLTSSEIKNIRDKYEISQKDLSKSLGWGELTVTRYENHQVQDRAHDDVLLCIKENPLEMYKHVVKNKDNLSESAYKRIIKEVKKHLPESKNKYLLNSIFVDYDDYSSEKYQGNTKLDLNKVIEMTNYFAEEIEDLYTVKLMKLLWYTDNLHYKQYNKSITGLKYFKQAMGALPQSYERIILLEGIKSEPVMFDEMIGWKFKRNQNVSYVHLNQEEKETIDFVVKRLGTLPAKEIVSKMHDEEAFRKTKNNHPISFEYAKCLNL